MAEADSGFGIQPMTTVVRPAVYERGRHPVQYAIAICRRIRRARVQESRDATHVEAQKAPGRTARFGAAGGYQGAIALSLRLRRGAAHDLDMPMPRDGTTRADVRDLQATTPVGTCAGRLFALVAPHARDPAR
ncbi:MAG: hypothetical protein OHK0044_30430 [Burkholderiaceae bacterium]